MLRGVLFTRRNLLPSRRRSFLTRTPPRLNLQRSIRITVERAAIDAHLVRATTIERIIIFVIARIIGVWTCRTKEPNGSLNVDPHAYVFLSANFSICRSFVLVFSGHVGSIILNAGIHIRSTCSIGFRSLFGCLIGSARFGSCWSCWSLRIETHEGIALGGILRIGSGIRLILCDSLS